MRDDAANQGTAGPAPCDGAQALVRKARHRADEPEVLLEIALQLVAGAHPEEAREVFELGRTAAPERIEFDLGVGASLLQAGEHERARRHIAGHLERHPGSAVGWAHLAVSLHGLGRREEVLFALCQSISLDPSDPQALAFFYQVHEEVGATEEAKDSLERFAADLAAVGPLLFLARLALRAGERERAAETLDRALEELDREDAAAAAETAGLLLELERVGECIELLEPFSGELEFAPLLCLAQAYAGAGEPELARGLLARLEDLAAGAGQRTQVRAVERELARSAG